MGREESVGMFDGFDYSNILGRMMALKNTLINIPTEVVKENLLMRIRDSVVHYSRDLQAIET